MSSLRASRMTPRFWRSVSCNEGFKGKSDSRGARQGPCSRGQFGTAHGVLNGDGTIAWPQGLRLGRNGRCIHGCAESLPGFWTLVGHCAARACHRRPDFYFVFYHEPRLFWVSIILGSSFIFNGAGVQHTALLERQMRFTALAAIEVICLIVSTLIGISMAVGGFGYWALVAAAVSIPLVGTLCLWRTTGWIPGRPRLQIGLHSMMRFGGGFTLVNLVVYTAYNLEKVLLGRFWGADALGLYGRAYQLINLPTDNLNSAFWGVAFSGLSRVRHEPERFRSYFLRGYSLVLALTIPMTLGAALFAHDMIFVLLGPKWNDVAGIFRLLAPTILIFALINPLAWLTFSLGMIGRNLKIVLVLAPLIITGYVL